MGKLSFGTTGMAYQCDKVDLKTGAPRCPRCTDRVYFNEEKKALNKSWHKRCFTCAKCKKSLDSTNCNGHEEEIFCTACHRRNFGPKGYGFAGGAAGLSTESSFHNVRPVSQIQTQAVPKSIPSSQTADPDSPDCCPKCSKRVFFAEEVLALKRKFHRLCFKCGQCNKMLEPGRCNEHQGSLYCQACYGKRYGPTGYGYAGGAGNLLSSSDVQPFRERGNFQRHSVSETSAKPVRHGEEWTEAISQSDVQPFRERGNFQRHSVAETPAKPVRDGEEWTEAVYI